MKKELDVVAALIKDSGKILLCQRLENDCYPNLWEFPGGCVEEGEELSQAIKREIDEELGLVILPGKMIKEFFDEDENLKIKVFLFACLIKSGQPETKECQKFGFFSLSDIESVDLAPVDRKIFNYIKSIDL